MKKLPVLFIALLLMACHITGSGRFLIQPREMMGFWQNVNDKDDYICLSYDMEGLRNGKGFWGTFPLALDPKDPNKSDSVKYYAHPSYSGTFEIGKEKIICKYNTANSTKYSSDGEMKLLKPGLIRIPTGTYKQLTDKEVQAINPHAVAL